MESLKSQEAVDASSATAIGTGPQNWASTAAAMRWIRWGITIWVLGIVVAVAGPYVGLSLTEQSETTGLLAKVGLPMLIGIVVMTVGNGVILAGLAKSVRRPPELSGSNLPLLSLVFFAVSMGLNLLPFVNVMGLELVAFAAWAAAVICLTRYLIRISVVLKSRRLCDGAKLVQAGLITVGVILLVMVAIEVVATASKRRNQTADNIGGMLALVLFIGAVLLLFRFVRLLLRTEATIAELRRGV